LAKLENNLQYVYRLEDSRSFGIYCKGTDGSLSAAAKCMREDEARHPNPFLDEMLMANLEKADVLFSDCFFCWESVQELKSWVYVDQWLIRLHSHGIKLAVYVCERNTVISGEHQSMFYSSLRKRQYDILGYFKLNAC